MTTKAGPPALDEEELSSGDENSVEEEDDYETGGDEGEVNIYSIPYQHSEQILLIFLFTESFQTLKFKDMLKGEVRDALPDQIVCFFEHCSNGL